MVLPKKEKGGFKIVKSYEDLERIYKGENRSSNKMLKRIATLPLSLAYYIDYTDDYVAGPIVSEGFYGLGNSSDSTATSGSTSGITKSFSTQNSSTSSSKNYSKTNIQVENVDEADVTKTDGNYIYSLSEDKIVITDVSDVENAKFVSTITMKSSAIPQELLINDDKLVVIGTKKEAFEFYTSYSATTNIEIFDISDKANPISLKNVEIDNSYYTCRSIGNNVYILSSGYLRKDSDDKFMTYYTENNIKKEIAFSSMYYMKDVCTTSQTIITGIDLNNISKDAEVKTYFIDLDNAYVSENSIYVAENDYTDSEEHISIKDLFGLGGIIGFVNKIQDMTYNYYNYNEKTNIYKFAMNGTEVSYVAKASDKGRTINQFSMDEYAGNLRVALYDNDGTRINIYDSNMKKIGQTDNMAKGEKMYSSRFVGNKAYLVTYKNMDPLFVVDLSAPSAPKVLGELKIPGYSTYLHPYDENHIIGIGMQTTEIINRRLDGTVYSTSSKIVGMKMALFDVTDVNNPKQISETVIGNRRTTSAILTNHKALLFSKEKNLIAIPVNNYESDFEVSNSSNDVSSIISSYTSNMGKYIAEGYEVYNIDLQNGFVKKGTITHELGASNSYTYRTLTHLLRGMYIEDNLYTVSEKTIKINKLDNLELLKEIKINNSEEN